MALPDNPLTRSEQYLNRTATGGGTIPDEPYTRVEKYLAYIAGDDVTLPDFPITRMEQYLDYIAQNGGGGVDPESITLVTLNVNQNGTTNAPSGKAYNKVVASVPNSYAAGDEGKVVSSGALVSQTNETVTENGTVDTTTIKQVTVNVPTGGAEPTGTKNITISQNGTTSVIVAGYESADIAVNVPNSYTSSDEGKVVSNGSLVAQTSQNITENGTVDTTTINSVTVNVPTGGGDPNVIVYEFTPVSDIAPSQSVSFNVGAVNAKIVAFSLAAKNFPAQNPPSGQWYFLNGYGVGADLTSVGAVNGASVSILRADGTLGSGTSGEFNFNASTGILTLLPQYGRYVAGEEYRFVLQIGGVNT